MLLVNGFISRLSPKGLHHHTYFFCHARPVSLSPCLSPAEPSTVRTILKGKQPGYLSTHIIRERTSLLQKKWVHALSPFLPLSLARSQKGKGKEIEIYPLPLNFFSSSLSSHAPYTSSLILLLGRHARFDTITMPPFHFPEENVIIMCNNGVFVDCAQNLISLGQYWLLFFFLLRKKQFQTWNSQERAWAIFFSSTHTLVSLFLPFLSTQEVIAFPSLLSKIGLRLPFCPPVLQFKTHNFPSFPSSSPVVFYTPRSSEIFQKWAGRKEEKENREG